MNTPARAAVATAIPITVAKTGRTLMPTSRAVSRSSAVARTLRPQDVRDSSSCRPDRTAHAVRPNGLFASHQAAREAGALG